MPVRLDKELHKILREGARRTPHKRQELVRMTLRLHLRDVIEREALDKETRPLTNIEPLPRKLVEAAYRRIGKDWDELEDAATRAQGKPDFND